MIIFISSIILNTWQICNTHQYIIISVLMAYLERKNDRKMRVFCAATKYRQPQGLQRVRYQQNGLSIEMFWNLTLQIHICDKMKTKQPCNPSNEDKDKEKDIREWKQDGRDTATGEVNANVTFGDVNTIAKRFFLLQKIILLAHCGVNMQHPF